MSNVLEFQPCNAAPQKSGANHDLEKIIASKDLAKLCNALQRLEYLYEKVRAADKG